jgi:hypothetical protein
MAHRFIVARSGEEGALHPGPFSEPGGVRPSSGAATSDYLAATECSQALLSSRVAAPEDGRTPVQGVPGSTHLLPNVRAVWLLFAAVWLVTVPAFSAPSSAREPVRWWKGNLHTHSFWSDGDDFPESITDWYKTNGYHFLALSDHNVMQKGERWLSLTNREEIEAFRKYRERFGEKWIVERPLSPVHQVRLKTLAEFGRLFEQRDRFLLIPSEEISDKYKLLPIHINATNLRDLIKPQGGSNVTEVIQRNLDAVQAQRQRTGQPMFPHVNHPNFGWAITAEDLMPVRGDRFFEVYNGHPAIHNEGDEHHASIERMWDIVLAFRLSRLNLGPLYGLAVDDSHHYHRLVRTNSNPGRGWVMVRASQLHANAIIAAMEAGDFYASTGVRLKDVQRGARELSLEIEAEPGVSYKTEFVGTLDGFDPTSTPGPRPTNSIYAVTRRYSEQIGTVLAVVQGPRASYKLQGDELYVRARVTSSKPKPNAFGTNETEAAWTQPLVRAK